MTRKEIPKLLLCLVVLCVWVLLLARMLGLGGPSRQVLTRASAVAGRITGVEVNRQHYLYYLNGDETRAYDFVRYCAANPAQRRGMQPDYGYDPSDLSHSLRQGDYVAKAAQADTLTVRRGRRTTRWVPEPDDAPE